MEISRAGNYSSAYESAYVLHKKETAASNEKINKGAEENAEGAIEKSQDKIKEQAKGLSKLVPSVKFRVGSTFSTAKRGKTLTVNPKLLEKMQNDPKLEKEMKELIKGVETMTKLSESMYRGTGKKVVYRHGYIDENGEYRSCAYIRSESGNKMSEKLRQARKKNTERLITKTKEKAAERKEKLQEVLEEKKSDSGQTDRQEQKELGSGLDLHI